MSTGTPSAPSRAFGAFSAEVRKARSFPAIPRTLLFGVIALLAAAVFSISQASQFLAQGRGDALGGMRTVDVLTLLLHYGQVIPILLAAWVVGQDIPVGPRRAAFLATARRGALIAAKLATAGLVALLAGAACTIAALFPLAVAGGDSTGDTISLAPYGWLIGYWVLIALITASLVAATRSIALAVVPVLVWTIGLSDLLAVQIPALSGALDQGFKSAYLQGGAVPSATVLVAAGGQVIVALVVGSALFIRRDAQ